MSICLIFFQHWELKNQGKYFFLFENQGKGQEKGKNQDNTRFYELNIVIFHWSVRALLWDC